MSLMESVMIRVIHCDNYVINEIREDSRYPLNYVINGIRDDSRYLL